MEAYLQIGMGAAAVLGFVAWRWLASPERQEKKLREKLVGALSFSAVVALYEVTPPQSSVDLEARSRLLDLGRSQVRMARGFPEAYEVARLLFCFDDAMVAGLQADAVRAAIPLAASLEDAEALFDLTDPGSDLEHQVMLRQLELVTTVDECAEIWDSYGVDSEWGERAICKAAALIEAQQAQAA